MPSHLDRTRSHLPSDGLTLGDLRRRGVSFAAGDWEQLGTMQYLERLCVRVGLESRKGTPRNNISLEGLSASSIEADLVSLYLKFGVASAEGEARSHVAVLEGTKSTRPHHER